MIRAPYIMLFLLLRNIPLTSVIACSLICFILQVGPQTLATGISKVIVTLACTELGILFHQVEMSLIDVKTSDLPIDVTHWNS
jgi:hypothetical protein